jgi:hypothetical protein
VVREGGAIGVWFALHDEGLQRFVGVEAVNAGCLLPPVEGVAFCARMDYTKRVCEVVLCTDCVPLLRCEGFCAIASVGEGAGMGKCGKEGSSCLLIWRGGLRGLGRVSGGGGGAFVGQGAPIKCAIKHKIEVPTKHEKCLALLGQPLCKVLRNEVALWLGAASA